MNMERSGRHGGVGCAYGRMHAPASTRIGRGRAARASHLSTGAEHVAARAVRRAGSPAGCRKAAADDASVMATMCVLQSRRRSEGWKQHRDSHRFA